MQKRINSIKKQTENRFLNMYELDFTHRDGDDESVLYGVAHAGSG